MSNQMPHDRIFSLEDVNAYPGRPLLDRVVQLHWSPDSRRRMWLKTPESSPEVVIAGKVFRPQAGHAGAHRWVDYGVIDLPGMEEAYPIWDGMTQIGFSGLKADECAQAWLVLTPKLELSLVGKDLTEVQRLLWGLAQEDVGSTSLNPTVMAAGQTGPLQARYRAGERGLPAGSIIRFVVAKVFTTPQTDDPEADGYVEILEPDAAVEIVRIRPMIETHEKSSIHCRLLEDLAPGRGFSLRYRTGRNFLFPRVFDEVEMRTWYSNLPPLTASAARDADSPFVNMLPENGHTFTLKPGHSERLHLFLPGRRFAGDPVCLRGTFTDRYRNVPPDGLIDLDFSLWLDDGNTRRALGSPAGSFQDRHRFALELPELAPGVYRVFALRNGSEEELARSNPLEIVEGRDGERLYWGEIHCHTGLSDGSGDFSEVYRHAREEGWLDFATVTDHAEYISDNQWEWMQDVINGWNEPGRFTTLVGYEWIGVQKDRIIYTSRDRLPLFRGNDPAHENLDDFWKRFDGDPEIVGGPHATMVHKTRFEQHTPGVECFAEIYSMWGSSDFRDSPLAAPWMEPDRGIPINDMLMQGAKLGFTGGGDCHDGRVGFTSEDPDGQGTVPQTNAVILLYRCGMTAANMPRLDRRDLVQALRNRRTYATTGARMLVDFSVSGIGMGGEGRAGEVVCRGRVHAVSDLKEAQIVRAGRVVWTQPLGGLDVEIEWKDPDPLPGEQYYYLHVIQQDGHRAWASPVWITSA